MLERFGWMSIAKNVVQIVFLQWIPSPVIWGQVKTPIPLKNSPLPYSKSKTHKLQQICSI